MCPSVGDEGEGFIPKGISTCPQGDKSLTQAFSDTEIDVLKLLTSELTRDFTILNISERIGRTPRLTYAAEKKLSKRGLVTVQAKANLKLCRINLRHTQTIAFIESLRWNDFAEKASQIDLLVSDIVSKSELPFFSLVVFGSYAKGTVTKRSDLDLLLVTPDRKFESTVEIAVKSAEALSNVPVHEIITTYSEFSDMLAERKINVAKEVIQDRLVAYGAEPLYALLRRFL
jgi:predicted nucleotidyltransferase